MRKTKWGLTASVALVVGLSLTGCATSGWGGATSASSSPSASNSASPSPSSSPSTKPKTKSEPTVKLSPAEINALTVRTVAKDAKCTVDKNGLVSFDIGALHGLVKSDTELTPRGGSDYVSTPNIAQDPQGVLKEDKQSGCNDPLLGTTYAVFLATDVRQYLLKLTGVDLVVQNPWLKPFEGKVDEINTIAASYIPLLDIEKPMRSDYSSDASYKAAVKKYDATAAKAVKQNKAWQTIAPKINTLWDKFELIGFGSPTSQVHYHLANGGMEVGSLPQVTRGPPESLEALILVLTQKGQCAPLLEIGLNVNDKSPELFEVPSCVVTPPSSGCSGSCGTTTKPKCEAGYYWNGIVCLLIKLHKDDVAPVPGVTNDQGTGAPTTEHQGTGSGTSGNVISSGTTGQQTDTQAGSASAGNTTATGGDAGDATKIDPGQAGTPTDPNKLVFGPPQ